MLLTDFQFYLFCTEPYLLLLLFIWYAKLTVFFSFVGFCFSLLCIFGSRCFVEVNCTLLIANVLVIKKKTIVCVRLIDFNLMLSQYIYLYMFGYAIISVFSMEGGIRIFFVACCMYATHEQWASQYCKTKDTKKNGRFSALLYSEINDRVNICTANALNILLLFFFFVHLIAIALKRINYQRIFSFISSQSVVNWSKLWHLHFQLLPLATTQSCMQHAQ